MVNGNDRRTPKPRYGRLFWIAGMALGVLAGALVAIELMLIGG